MKLSGLSRTIGTFLTLAILTGLFVPQHTLGQSEQEEYFAETGHWVSGPFLEFFYMYGGLEIFGYPITERFLDQGLWVQYFQKARMEWHPDNPDPYKVQLGLLAEELHYRRPAVPPPQPRSRRKVHFPETGHSVSYAFLDYFRAHHNIFIFGYPITEMYFEDGKIVQYFQRMKMEWHPDDPASNVQIGNLGDLYVSIYRDRMPPEALRRADPNARVQTNPPAIAQVTGIRAVVSLRYSVMTKKSNQIVSVLVTDTNGDPIPNAKVTFSFETASSEKLPGSTRTLVTDDRGFARASIPVSGGRTGTPIIVKANVEYNGLTTDAQNVFLIWWNE